MISDAMVLVECDTCGTTTHIPLTALTRGTYGSSYVLSHLRNEGWTITALDAETYCDQCFPEDEDDD